VRSHPARCGVEGTIAPRDMLNGHGFAIDTYIMPDMFFVN
jgi:hypothetical protein